MPGDPCFDSNDREHNRDPEHGIAKPWNGPKRAINEKKRHSRGDGDFKSIRPAPGDPEQAKQSGDRDPSSVNEGFYSSAFDGKPKVKNVARRDRSRLHGMKIGRASCRERV